MATVLPIYGGPTKRTLVQLAYGLCGHADYDFELTPEEFESAIRRLNAIMSRLRAEGIDLGYNFPTNAAVSPGAPQDESGIPDDATQAVSGLLARATAPQIGKTLSGEANGQIAGAVSLLRSQYVVLPIVNLRRDTMRGSGNRYPFGSYFTGRT